MFRRTLLVFLATVFVALAATVGYALLGLGGPSVTIDAARTAHLEGRHGDAIRLLDLADAELEPHADTEARARLLDLRYRAYRATGNLRPALRDLTALRELRPDDRDLLHTQIRTTITAGDTGTARRLAEQALDAAPDAPALIELAGEAAQANYQARVREFVTRLSGVLDDVSSRRAFAHVRRWLYGAPGDPATERALESFRALLKEVSPESWAARTFDAELQDLRSRVQDALRYFRRALESDGQPVGAYVGLAYALEQAERDDDRAWLGELYLRRYDHVHTVRAAGDLAELHVSRNRPRAALDVYDRYFAAADWRERLATGRLDGEVRHLAAAAARAAAQLDRDDRLATIATTAEAMHDDPRLELLPELDWIRGLHFRARGDNRAAMESLGTFERALGRMPQSDRVVRARIAVMNTRIELAHELNWRGSWLENALRRLEHLDPENPTPVIERSRLKIAADDPAGALIALRQARYVPRYDEQVLRLQANALDAELSSNGRGADEQLRRCIELDTDTPPNVPDLLLLPLAELALESDRNEIALECARRATTAVSWASWPRELMVRAAFALDRPETALVAAEEWLGYHPENLDALRALRRAREALGRPVAGLAYDLLLAGERDGDLAAQLLRDALQRDDRAVALHLARAIERTHADDAGALLLVADVHERTGDLQSAHRILKQAARRALDSDPETLREAFSRYFLVAAAVETPPDVLRLLFERCLDLVRADPERMFELARQLDALHRPDQAYLMLQPVLTSDEHADYRSGSHFLLAGRLALALGDETRAEEHFEAAMTFADGALASAELTLLLLLQDRVAAARNAWWEPRVDDLGSACLAAQLERHEQALEWAHARIADNHFDARTLALLALLEPSDAHPSGLRRLAAGQPELLLDTLACLGTEGFARQARRAAAELVERSDRNPFARLLAARAVSKAGDSERAIAMLERVLDEHPLLLPAYETAMRIVEDAGLDPLTENPLLGRLTRPELLRGGVAPPGMVALATQRHAAALLARIGDRGHAVELLAELWTSQPQRSGASLDNVDVLAGIGRIDLALRLCAALEPHLDAAQRERFLATYFALAQAAVERDAPAIEGDEATELVEQAVSRARRVIRREGAYGVAVHFLYSRELARGGPVRQRSQPERYATLRGLLRAHLEFVREHGVDSDRMLERTLRRIEQLDGREAALEVIESVLRAHPSMLELFLLRGRWLAGVGRATAALDGLRWLYHYAPSHPAVLGVAELAAVEGVTTVADRQAVDGLDDDATLQSADGRLTRGLLALRAAEHRRAAELLSDAAARPDGTQLYYLGLASLRAGDAAAATRALERLAADYPDSALSSNAGHFARQLAH